MSKYESTEILPLKVVNSLESYYQGCWDMIGFKLADIKNNAINYEQYFSRLVAWLKKYNAPDENHRKAIACTLLIAAVWRKNKQIFNFDKEILKEFCNQKINFDMPTEIFEQLPYPCIYIAVDGFGGLNGIWVMKCSDDLGNKYICINLFAAYDRITGCRLDVNGNNTINDIIKSYFDNQKVSRRSKKEKEYLREKLKLALQCLLYICAANAEIEEDPIQKTRYRAPSAEEFIKDKVREVKKWNCGKRESKIIYSDFGLYPRVVPAMKEDQIRNVKSSSKRCHVRRSHWHHYWTGSSKNGTRRMELRWISAMTIHKEEYEEESPNLRINNVYVS